MNVVFLDVFPFRNVIEVSGVVRSIIDTPLKTFIDGSDPSL